MHQNWPSVYSRGDEVKKNKAEAMTVGHPL